MAERVLDSRDFLPPDGLGRIRTVALSVGALGAVLCGIGFVIDREQFFQSYLVGWVFWVAVAIACLGWQMVQHLTAGGWGLVLRRTLEAGARTIPFLFVLFLPFLLGMDSVWHWASEEAAGDALIQKKVLWLNVPFFWARIFGYFAIWTLYAYLLSHYSKKQDETGAPAATVRMRVLSGPGVVLFVLTATAASWDLLMSLDAHWFSSLYGFYFVTSTALTGMLFMTVAAWWLAQRPPMNRVLTAKHFHDYGKLTLALVMFWAYMALSQFLITWSGNVPEFAVWYQDRNTGGWKPFTVLLILFHFFVPFLILLSATLKKQPGKLVLVALYLLFMRWIDLYWQTAPNFHDEITVHWLDLAAMVAVGGLWIFLFVGELGKRSLIPINDPYLPDLVPAGSHERP